MASGGVPVRRCRCRGAGLLACRTLLDRGQQGKDLNFGFIQEVQVKAGGYSAEYGHSTGGVINAITRSGGNETHGDVFGYWDDHALRSSLKGDAEQGRISGPSKTVGINRSTFSQRQRQRQRQGAAHLSEGHGRSGRDRTHHQRSAYASAKEVDSHLRLVTRANAVNTDQANAALGLNDEVRAMTWRLLNPRR